MWRCSSCVPQSRRHRRFPTFFCCFLIPSTNRVWSISDTNGRMAPKILSLLAQIVYELKRYGCFVHEIL